VGDAAGELRLAGHPGSAVRKNKFLARRKPGGFDIVNEGSVRTPHKGVGQDGPDRRHHCLANIQSECVT
jgi:hypothetical protein